MNKKTFALSVIFLILTLAWLGINIYWVTVRPSCVSAFDFIVAGLFIAFAAAMVYNESHKKRRRHIEEVDKNQIP